jgi:hypothetical protein
MTERKPKSRAKLEQIVQDDKIAELFTLQNVLDLFTEYSLIHYELDTSKVFDNLLQGYCDYYNREIGLFKYMRDVDKRETIIHEIVHALKDKYSVDDKEKDTERQGKILLRKLYIPNNSK